MTDNTLSDLARARAVFQQRTLKTLLTEGSDELPAGFSIHHDPLDAQPYTVWRTTSDEAGQPVLRIRKSGHETRTAAEKAAWCFAEQERGE